MGLTKLCFQKILCASPELNTTRFNMFTFAGLRVDRLGVLLFHLRRLCNDSERISQCAGKCTRPQFIIERELVVLCATRNTSMDCSIAEVAPAPAGEPIPFPNPTTTHQRSVRRKVWSTKWTSQVLAVLQPSESVNLIELLAGMSLPESSSPMREQTLLRLSDFISDNFRLRRGAMGPS